MYQQKTNPTDDSVIAFLETIENPKKKEDAYTLLEICEKESGYKGVMWGSSLIGFGTYHYVYKSGHSGNAPLFGFAPRKNNISIYSATGDEELKTLLPRFGKYTMGKACIYVKKLEDIDLEVFKEILHHSIAFLTERYEII